MPREGTRPTRISGNTPSVVGPVPSPGGFFNRLLGLGAHDLFGGGPSATWLPTSESLVTAPSDMFAIADARMLTASYTSGGATTSDTRGDVFMLYDFGYSGTYFMGFNGSAVTTSETQLFRTTGRCQANI